jgi:hypothetical protein
MKQEPQTNRFSEREGELLDEELEQVSGGAGYVAESSVYGRKVQLTDCCENFFGPWSSSPERSAQAAGKHCCGVCYYCESASGQLYCQYEG